MTMQQYCLRWNNHQPNFISVFSSLLNNESLVDVTLAAEGRHLQAHKVVLSACSSYFQSLFTINPCQHPIVILKDVKFLDLKIMVDFMYYGEVNVSQEQLPHILKTAEMLKIKGLAEIPVDQSALTKSHNSSTDKAELLTPGDSNWSSDDLHRHSVSPSPCPLSPASKRKRLRKASTGSGSGSTERTSEDHTNEVTLTSPGGGTVSTVIKPDPGNFTSERCKQHSTESEPHRGSSQESVDCDPPLHITLVNNLQVPQQNSTHNLEGQDPLDIAGPSTIPQQTNTGYQWGIVEGTYPRFAALTSCHTNISAPTEINYNNTSNLAHCPTSASPAPVDDHLDSTINTDHISSSPPNVIQKRKRSINPQADENFVRALDAVRYGGIGFCKAAKMYGVNNRTLWLEYKKRGYPNNRISIKNRKQEFVGQPCVMTNPGSPMPTSSADELKTDIICTNSEGGIVSTNYIDARHIDLTPILERPRYSVNINSQQTLALSGVNFEHM
ncbi:hypothetical protein FQA39_LY01888 [Lamprigera yunnana]|nr:hypothetical protein FQA39_LY01888 [Lamprigera yunnana]